MFVVMQIFVKRLGKKTVTIHTLGEGNTVRDLKVVLEEKAGGSWSWLRSKCFTSQRR